MDEVMLFCAQASPKKYTIKPHQAAQHKYPLELLCEMAGAVLDKDTTDLLEYRHIIKHPEHKLVWGSAFGKEIGHLAQGLTGIVEGTDTIDFISLHDIP